MIRRLAALAAVVAVLQIAAPAAATTGDLVFQSPLIADGDVFTSSGETAVHLSTDEATETTLYESTSERVKLTRVYWDYQTVGDRDLLLVDPPADDPVVEVHHFDSATIRASDLQPTGEILVASGATGVFDGPAPTPRLVIDTDRAFEVVDGFRRNLDAGPVEKDYHFTFTMAPDHLRWMSDHVEVTGDHLMYAWGASVEVCADECRVFETGIQTDESGTPGTYNEHWEYLFLEGTAIEGVIERGDSNLVQHALAASVVVNGTLRLPAAQGVIHADDGTYRATGAPLVVQGDVRLDVSPVPSSSPPSLTEARRVLLAGDVGGDITSINLAPISTEEAISPAVAGAAAGGIGLLAAGVWFLSSAKGAAMVAPLIARTRRHVDIEAADLNEDPLLHPDRHRVYYLLQRRGVLTADEARTALGIRDAADHLALLAEHDLVRTRRIQVANKRRTYFVFPGVDMDQRVERLARLMDEHGGRLAELLDVYGEVDVNTLLHAAVNAPPHASPGRTRQMLEEFVELGLARRETVAGAVHVAPTDELRKCLLLRAGHAVAGRSTLAY